MHEVNSGQGESVQFTDLKEGNFVLNQGRGVLVIMNSWVFWYVFSLIKQEENHLGVMTKGEMHVRKILD